MASVKNLILNFVFQTQGAGSATRDLNNLNKAQTRLGQSSASAGRSFSSQAQGLGGLVAAYAGAAATTFALQQAFDKLSKSARTIQTLEGLNTLASSVGASGTQLLTSVREITKAQLTIADSAAQINLSLSAGFNTQQIERLSGVALKASRALGRDLNDAYTRVVRGSAKMETELLDELGIYTKIEPATRAYAASIGKSVSSLSEFERRQAFVNAVITEGERKFSGINTTLATTSEKIEAFGTRMLDIAMIFGGELVQRLEPIIDFFSDNFPAAVALAMAAAGMLARKGIGELSNYLAAATQQKLQNAIALENLIRKYAGLTPATIKASDAIGKITAATTGLNKADKARFDTLKATSQERALTRSELKEISGLSQKVADSYANQRNAIRAATTTQSQNNRVIQQEFRDRTNALNVLKEQQAAIRANSALTSAQRRTQASALTPQIQAAQNRLTSITPDARQSAADTKAMLDQYRALNNAKNEYTRSVQASGAAMTGWAAKSAAAIGAVGRVWSIATAGVVAFTAKLVSGLGFILSAVAIFTIVGTALAKLFGVSEELTAIFSNLLQAATKFLSGGALKSIKTALDGIAGSTIAQLEKANEQFKNIESFTFKKKFLGVDIEIQVSKEDLIRQATSAVTDAAKDKGFIEKSKDNYFTSGKNIGSSIAFGILAGVLSIGTGGTAAIAIGIGAAIVSGIGSGAVEAAKEQGDLNAELNVSADRVKELKTSFSSTFDELNSGLEGQDIKLASILDKEAQRIGATKIVTAEQKLYLETFAQVATQQLNQLKNLETIITLSRSLGKTSGQIVELFDISPDSTKTFSTIKTNLEAVASDSPIALPVTFKLLNLETGVFPELQKQIEEGTARNRLSLIPIDVEGNKQAKAALSSAKAYVDSYGDTLLESINRTGSLEGAIADLDSWFYRGTQNLAKNLKTLGLTTEDVLSILEPGNFKGLDDLGTRFNDAGISSIRAADNFNAVVKQASEGGLSFEQFQQGLTSIDTALTDSSAKFKTLIPDLIKFEAGLPEGKLKDTVLALIEMAKATEASNRVTGRQLETLKSQENYYRRLTEYATFLKEAQDSTKINFFDYEAQTVAASKLISIDQARVQVLLDQAAAQKKLADEAKLALTRAPRDRQGGVSQADYFQTQALGEYTQSLEIAAATLRNMAPSMIRVVEESKKLTAEVNKQIADQQYQLEIVKQQATAESKLIALRASAAAADLAVFNAEKALEGITAQIELNDKLFSIEESRAERAKSQLDLIQEATQASYTRQIEAVQAVSAEEDRASARRVANLEKQIQQINSIRDLAKNVDQAVTALQLSFLKAPTVEQSPVEDTFSKEITLRRQLLQEEILAAERSASNQKSILNLQAQAEADAVRNQITQLTNEKVLADSRVRLLQDQRALLVASEDAQIDLLRKQDEARKAAAAIDLANLQRQKVDLAVKYSQDVKNLDNERQLSVKKATDDIDANIRYLQSIQTQKNVFGDFLDAYGALIKAQAAVVGKQIDVPARDAGELDFNKLMKDLTDAKQAVTNSYKSLYSLQQDALLATVLSSQAALDQEISAINEKTKAEDAAFNTSITAREALKAANIAASDEEIATAQQAVSAILNKRNELANKIKDIETKLQQDIADIDAQTGDAKIAAQQKFNDFLISGLTEVTSAMEDAASRYQDIIIDAYTQIRALAAEKIEISAKIDIDSASFARQLEATKKQFEIERLQGDLNVIEAKKSSGSMPAMDAAKAINDKQQEILTAQGQLVELERTNALANIKDQEAAAYKQMQDNQRRIQAETDLQKSKIQAEMELLAQQGTLYKANTESLEGVNKNNIKALTDTFNNLVFAMTVTFNRFGASLSSTFGEVLGEKVGFAMSEAVKINAAELESVEDKFSEATTSMIEWGVAAQDSLDTRSKAEQALEETKFRQTYEGLQQEAVLVNANADQKLALLDRQNAAETENAKARLKEAKEAGDKQKEKLDELKNKYNEAIGKLKDAFVNLIKDVVETIGSMVTKGLERKVEMAKVNEAIANSNLAATSEKLSEAQSKQQDLMQKEISLRDEIQESYKSLAETQKTYIDSLTGDDRSIKQSSRVLIDNILSQKRKQIDLSKTINERIRQDSYVQTLEYRKLSQEQQLEEATNIRIAAEEKLAETQAIIAQITSVLSGEMFKLANSLQSVQLAAAGINDVSKLGAEAGFGMQDLAGGLQGFGNKLMNNLLFGNQGGSGILNNVVNSLGTAAKSLTNVSSYVVNSVNAAGKVAPSFIGPMPQAAGVGGAASGAAGFFGTAGAAIGGAMTGFGVGNLVGMLTNDPGMGSSIGGAIGGALASGLAIAVPSIFASGTVLGGIASGIGSALGMAMNFAIPVVGALVGALIGRLFSKTPKAGATGQLTSEGYTMTSSYESKVAGGTAKNLSDIAGSTLGGMVENLQAMGIQFKDIVNTSINLRKNSITGASLEFAGGARFEKGGSGTGQEDLKALATFYLDSFVKGLRKGSLVVDQTVKGAADLQSAIDKFISEDQGTKTIERFKEVLDYAAGFSGILDKLGEAIPVTMEDALSKVVEGSKAAASAVSAQYNDLKNKVIDVFGSSSDQFDQLTRKLKENALSQLGLAKGSDGIIRSVDEANNQLNAGTIAVTNIIEGITNFDTALKAAGFAASEAADIIDTALNTQLTTFIGAIGEDLKNSIDVLKNPALQSSIELKSIIDNAQDRNKEAEGVLAGLRASENKIAQSSIGKALDNVAMSVELGALEIEKYLESLNIEQLKAVIADEDRIDAATRLAASSRLVAMEDQDRAQAAKQFVKVSRDFNKALAEITKSSAVPQFIRQATSVIEVAELLGRNSIDQFSIDFANLINSISRGENIVFNFETAIEGLNGQISSGAITNTQLVEALDLLQSTTLDSIQVLQDLVSSVEDTTSQIYDLYSTSLANLVTSTEELGTSFNELLDGFSEKTQTVLGLFDDTLKSVAESGNKLYNLRDSAKEAFTAAADSVSEFEKNNKLTGRTAAQVTAELASVSSQIDSISSKPFDFASFLNLSSLSSKQSSLSAELDALNAIQEEYSKLLAARTTAEQDYLFSNKTVTDLEASTTSKLIDTRIKESEVVQEVTTAALDFVTSQKDLQDITQLLTAANFNLNQARFEERDRVVQVSEALRDLTTIAGDLIAEVTGINATDINAVKAQAKLAAEIQYGTAATAQITAAVDKAVAEFTALKSVATSVASVVTSTVGVGKAFTDAVKTTSDTLKIYDSLLTDSFKGYTSAISGYITNISTILKTSFDAKDNANFTGFITNLNKTQEAFQLLNPTLAQLLADSKLGVISGITKSISESITTFKTNAASAVAGLLDAFSPARKTKVDDFRNALAEFDKIGTTINATGGLKEAIFNVGYVGKDTATKVATLASNFSTLNTSMTTLQNSINTSGGLLTNLGTHSTNVFTDMASRLSAAWNSIQLQVQTNLGTGITLNAPSNNETNARLTDLQRIGEAQLHYATIYPGISGVNYVRKNFYAEGGYVEGPGSDTSDSVPAQLSNGEYVVKASAVRKIGVDTLDDINSGKQLANIMADYGRNGDTMLAHIMPEEADLLKMLGGAGTMNPMSTLPEFFNKDGGAIGSLFAQQEKDLLWKTYGDKFITSNFQSNFGPDPRGTPEAVNMSANSWNPWGDNLWTDQYYHKLDGSWAPGDNGLFAWDNKAKLIDSQKATISLSNEVLKARDQPITDFSQFAYAQDWFGYDWGTRWGVNKSITNKSQVQTGWGPYTRQVRDLFRRRNQYFEPNSGGWKAKSGQALSQFMSDNIGANLPHNDMQVTPTLVSQAVDAANARNPNFTDLYMLGNTNPAAGRPTAAMLANGGLVTDEFSASTARDSVNAMLEPGEFVLRKQAVDKMGIDNAIRLNSTGETQGDIEVEVNINNNGTNQTTIGTPEVRRENGKIVVDIILEDLRTNGPINRQIRSIR